MGKIRLSLVLMLLAALVVALAGWHQARRSEVHRIEIDRKLFASFASEFQKLVHEKDESLVNNSIAASTMLATLQDTAGKALLETTPGARASYLFREGRRTKTLELLGSVGDPSLPDVVVKGGKQPLNPASAIFLTEVFFEDARFGTSGWVKSEDEQHALFWSSPVQGEINTILFSVPKWRDLLVDPVKQEATAFYDPIHKAGDRVNVTLQDGPILLGLPVPAILGPPSMIDSFDFSLGRIWLRAWNREESQHFFHWPTMMTAGLISLSLAATAAFLYASQSRAWRESMERVSFANRVSHELGTPLTNMTLNLELAACSLRSQPEAAGERLEKVREEIGRLSRLVSNVLGYSKEDRQGNSALGSPDQVIEDVLTQFRPALERRNIEISWQPNASTKGMLDRDALSQIVWNLISNVEKYAASGQWLGLSTTLNGDQLIVDV